MILGMHNPTGRVVAKRKIEQSPLSDGPAVPAGAVGFIQDEADGWLWVDFLGPYGVVCCAAGEVE